MPFRFDRLRFASNGFVPGAVVDYDFRRDRYSGPPLTVSRASPAYIDDTAGNWTLVPANTLRRSDKGALIEGAQTNSTRNNSMQGAVVGSPGTLPTNWFQSNNTGIVPRVAAVGTENGIDYIDLVFAGTTTGAGQTNLIFDANTSAAAASGQLWTASVFAKLVAGSFTNVSNSFIVVQGSNASGTPVEASTGALLNGVTTGPLSSQRLLASRTMNNANTAFSNAYLQINMPSGVAVNFTLRIGWPQLEQWNTGVTTVGGASSPIRTTGAAATRAADVVTATLPAPLSAATIAAVLNQPSFPVILSTVANISDGTGNNRMKHYHGNDGSTVAADFAVGNVNNLGLSNSTMSALAGRRAEATGFDANGTSAALNGGTPGSNSSAITVPTTLNKLSVGSNVGGALQTFGYIERLAIWPTRLTNGQLQQYSTLATWGG